MISKVHQFYTDYNTEQSWRKNGLWKLDT